MAISYLNPHKKNPHKNKQKNEITKPHTHTHSTILIIKKYCYTRPSSNVMPPILLSCSMMSEEDGGGMVVEVEPFH